MSVASSPSLLKLVFIIVLGTFISGCDTKSKGPSNEKVVADYKAQRKSLNKENDTKIFTKNVSMKVMDMVTKTKHIEVVSKKVIAEDRIVYSILIETVPKQLVMALAVAETEPLIQRALNQFRKLPGEIAALQIKQLDDQFKKQPVMYTGLELTYVETSKDFWKIDSINPANLDLEKIVNTKNSEFSSTVSTAVNSFTGKWIGVLSNRKKGTIAYLISIDEENGQLSGSMKMSIAKGNAIDKITLDNIEATEGYPLEQFIVSKSGDISFTLKPIKLGGGVYIGFSLTKVGMQLLGKVDVISTYKRDYQDITFNLINSVTNLISQPVIKDSTVEYIDEGDILKRIGGVWTGTIHFKDISKPSHKEEIGDIEITFTEDIKQLKYLATNRNNKNSFKALTHSSAPISHYYIRKNKLTFITILEAKQTKLGVNVVHSYTLDISDNNLSGKMIRLNKSSEDEIQISVNLERRKTLEDLAEETKIQKDKQLAWISNPDAKWFTSKNITEKLKVNSLARNLKIKTLDIVSKGRLCADIAWYKVRVKGKKRGRKYNEQLTLYFKKLPKFWTLLDPGYEDIRKTISNIEKGKCQDVID